MNSPDMNAGSAARMIAVTTSDEPLYPKATQALAEQRSRLAPEPAKAFRAFSKSVFVEGALPTKTKQLIAVAVAHVTQCPYCIRSHTRTALRQGATGEEIKEAMWVAAEMRAGGAYAHSALALDTLAHERESSPDAHARSAE
jgi:AhpD family alkylhydroperoxidase